MSLVTSNPPMPPSERLRGARLSLTALLVLLAALLLGAAGCTAPTTALAGESDGTDPEETAGDDDDDDDDDDREATADDEVTLEQVGDCDALRSWLVDALVEQWVGYGAYYNYYYDQPMSAVEGRAEAAPSTAPSASAADSGGSSAQGSSAPSSYTGTNNQEAGVDEMDFVKTDGKYIYILQGNTFSIVRSFPAKKAEQVSSLKLAGYGSSIFLHGDRVVIAANVYNQAAYGNQPAIEVPFPSGSATRLTFVDISDRSEPKIERTVDLEGWLASGRLIGSNAWFVTNHTPTTIWEIWNEVYPQITKWPDMPGTGTPQDQLAQREMTRAMLRPLVAAALDKRELDTYLPQMRIAVAGEDAGEPEALASCGDWLRPAGMPQLGTLTVTQIDLGDEDSKPRASGVLSSGWQVYASDQNLYVTGSNQNSWWWWGWNAWQNWQPQTVIHKFALDKKKGPRYRASGSVEGWMLNQFSMSEHDGFLRVATTTWDTWRPDGTQVQGANQLVVLEEHEGRLSTVGALEDLAPGERIYSARMMGDRGYLVTFRQVDPLFTIDLSKPHKPRLVGELKIPGYSAYLHPMDRDHLVAVGMAGTETGQLTGMAVSIFDVSNFAEPKLAHQYQLTHEGWTWSEALYDHHAFTYRDGILAIPASWYDSTGWFSGMQVLSIDAEDGIEPVGTANHAELAVQACVAYYTAYNAQYASQYGAQYGAYDYTSSCNQPGYAAGWAMMRRSIFIDDTLVSISSAGIKFSELDDPDDTLAVVVLPTTWW